MDISIFKQAREAYKQGDGHLYQLLDTLQQMVWTANANGKITYFNQPWYKYTGMKPGQTEGWVKVIHPEDSPQAISAWNNALVSGQFQVEHRIRNNEDGTYRWFLEQAEPITDDAGKTILWVGVFTDIDDLKQDQEV